MTQLLDELKTIIGFRSAGKDAAAKAACIDWIGKKFLQSSGIVPVRGVVGENPYILLAHPQPKLLWFGHVDVVPGFDEQFVLRVDGDTAYGRGTKDMKGAVLAFLLAYREACQAGNLPPVSVLITADEETGGQTPPTLINEGLFTNVPVAYTPDNGEAGGIITELKGGVWMQLCAYGKGGHAAMPWLSDSPISKLCSTLRMLEEKYPQSTDEDWSVTVTPTRLGASDAINRIGDEASCTLDVRFPGTIWKTPDQAMAALAKELPPDHRFKKIGEADPMICDPNHPMVQLIKTIAEDVTKTAIPLRREHGSSDARCFAANGIPAFVYGPTGGDLHGTNEWVSIKSLEDQVEINRRLLKSLSA